MKVWGSYRTRAGSYFCDDSEVNEKCLRLPVSNKMQYDLYMLILYTGEVKLFKDGA